jgi:hypothetical protein
MRLIAWAIAALAVLVPLSSAQAGYYGRVVGNDTGGIIPWSPATALTYRDMAAHHCAHYAKYARITSVRRRYGDYIAFQCAFPRYYDPVKAAATVVVRVRY